MKTVPSLKPLSQKDFLGVDFLCPGDYAGGLGRLQLHSSEVLDCPMPADRIGTLYAQTA